MGFSALLARLLVHCVLACTSPEKTLIADLLSRVIIHVLQRLA